MGHHAYVHAGTAEEGVQRAQQYGEQVLGLTGPSHPDLLILRYSLFSVEDARLLAETAARAPVAGSERLIVVTADRLFHESQNALLKLFEEPPEGVTLVLVVPTLGILLPTLASRLVPLPEGCDADGEAVPGAHESYLNDSEAVRKRYLDDLLERLRSDTDDTKEAAKREAAGFMHALSRAAYARYRAAPAATQAQWQAFASDLDAFMPLTHERAVPWKLIFEHLSLTTPS